MTNPYGTFEDFVDGAIEYKEGYPDEVLRMVQAALKAFRRKEQGPEVKEGHVSILHLVGKKVKISGEIITFHWTGDFQAMNVRCVNPEGKIYFMRGSVPSKFSGHNSRYSDSYNKVQECKVGDLIEFQATVKSVYDNAPSQGYFSRPSKGELTPSYNVETPWYYPSDTLREQWEAEGREVS